MKYIFKTLMALFTLFFFISCSDESVVETEVLDADYMMYQANPSNSLEWELFTLIQKTRPFYNHRVAIARGWDMDIATIPMMGHHFANMGIWDDVFELEKPEALLYRPIGNGKWQFLGVEYLIDAESTDPAPEGFMGDEDVWFYNFDAHAWTLHVWVAFENPDGLFAAFNPLVE